MKLEKLVEIPYNWDILNTRDGVFMKFNIKLWQCETEEEKVKLLKLGAKTIVNYGNLVANSILKEKENFREYESKLIDGYKIMGEVLEFINRELERCNEKPCRLSQRYADQVFPMYAAEDLHQKCL